MSRDRSGYAKRNGYVRNLDLEPSVTIPITKMNMSAKTMVCKKMPARGGHLAIAQRKVVQCA